MAGTAVAHQRMPEAQRQRECVNHIARVVSAGDDMSVSDLHAYVTTLVAAGTYKALPVRMVVALKPDGNGGHNPVDLIEPVDKVFSGQASAREEFDLLTKAILCRHPRGRTSPEINPVPDEKSLTTNCYVLYRGIVDQICTMENNQRVIQVDDLMHEPNGIGDYNREEQNRYSARGEMSPEVKAIYDSNAKQFLPLVKSAIQALQQQLSDIKLLNLPWEGSRETPRPRIE